MELTHEKYHQYGLVRDMLATPEIIAGFDTDQSKDTAQEIAGVGRVLLTGEGSSRLFPAKCAIAKSLRAGWPLAVFTEAGVQAWDYDLSQTAVFAASNSGKTAEVIQLFERLQEQRHAHCYSLTAFPESRLESLAKRGYVLTCGEEGAVAATKSVIEQALFYRALLEHAANAPALKANLADLSEAFEQALQLTVDEDFIEAVANARTIYWAGRNNGVAEELTLKTNEITRKPADFLEGTYAVHGIEEVLSAEDVVIWIDPYPSAEDKFHEVLERGVGLKIFAIADRETRFPTLAIPEADDLSPFVQMAAGWNVLVEVGLKLGINIDKPERARKVGNEYAAPPGQ
jgi:glucosamine--fructose-6-phosphate aminotransferase (isomerizing)